MKKRAIISLCIVLSLVFGMCIGTVATGGLETISAYLTYNTTIKLDGQVQTMYDANGKRVYPINYQGTTYIPIRAVSNMLDIDVNWDGATKTVLLGKPGTAMDFIETIEPYSGETKYHYSAADGKSATIAGTRYDHYIMPQYRAINYDLGSKYETLSFDAYSDQYLKLYFYGDNNTLLYSVDIVGGALPTHHTIDVTGVYQMSISQNSYTYDLYIYNTTIE